MKDIIHQMLARYNPQSHYDYKNALKEIFQEIALLGLWRAKFFDKAAFYGGTALRILYQLDRFSEDLDFSLLQTDPRFSLQVYERSIKQEFLAFGFEVSFDQKNKNNESKVVSAFLKGDSTKHLISIGVPEKLLKGVLIEEKMTIKLEVDTDPPPDFSVTSRYLLQPEAFYVAAYSEQDLFAGKMHALLCRAWGARVKGRDWYDFSWFVARGTHLNLTHLEARMRQTGHFSGEHFTCAELQRLLLEKIDTTDLEQAKKDILQFIKNPAKVDIWSKEYFIAVAEQMKTLEIINE